MVSHFLLLVAVVSTMTVAMAMIFLLSVSVALFNGASSAHVAVGDIGDGMAPATILVTTLVLVEDSEIAFLVLGLFVAVTMTVTMSVILLLVTVTMAAFLDSASGAHVAVGDVGDCVAPATVSVVSIVLIEDSAIRFILALARRAGGQVLVNAVGLVGLLLVIGVAVAVRSVTMGGVAGVRGVAVSGGRLVLAVSQGAGRPAGGLAKLAEGVAHHRFHSSTSKIKGSWHAVDSAVMAVVDDGAESLLGQIEGALHLGLLEARVLVHSRGRSRGVVGRGVTVGVAGLVTVRGGA